MWFTEEDNGLPGMRLGLSIKRVLHHSRSKYQDVMVFENESVGTVLALDGRIQTTTFDECSYQEMMALLPLSCHPNPERVLIVGGGDGAILRHVISTKCTPGSKSTFRREKDPKLKSVVLCEIDEEVVNVCKKYFPSEISNSLLAGSDGGTTNENDQQPSVEIRICDGLEYVKQCATGSDHNKFDVIITDSSDPDGPALGLFNSEYYQNVKKALRGPNGLFCSQGECMWIHGNLIKRVLKLCIAFKIHSECFLGKEHFPTVAYSYTTVPTYPAGCIGFFIGSLKENANMRQPVRDLSSLPGLKYYTTEVHRAAFALPKFLKELLSDIVENA